MTILEKLKLNGGNLLGFNLPNQMGLYGSTAQRAPLPAFTPTQQPDNTGMFGDPFGTAMSGNKSGTLQPFVNRNTQMANNALYGGLLGYQPQQLKTGDAGGTPVDPTPPQWRLPSAIPNANQAQVGLLGPQAENYNKPQPGIFGNRAWMEY
jgi:hypothetical protein